MLDFKRLAVLFWVAVGPSGLCAVGCGGAASGAAETSGKAVEEPRAAQEDTAPPEDQGVEVEGLLGTIPEEDVQRVFENGMDGLLACYGRVLEDIEEIQGDLEISLQIMPDGHVSEAFVQRSDLGSLQAETCIVDRVSRFVFPKTTGGRADVAHPLSFQAPYNPPEPRNWSGAIASDAVSAHGADVERCLCGKTGVHLTLWVGPGGAVASAGFATEAYALVEAGRCLAEAARQWVFPDPGAKLAKLRIDL